MSSGKRYIGLGMRIPYTPNLVRKLRDGGAEKGRIYTYEKRQEECRRKEKKERKNKHFWSGPIREILQYGHMGLFSFGIRFILG